MTPTEKHRETAEQIANDFRMIGDGCEGDLMEMIAAAMAEGEARETANLIGIIADIRQKSGVGAKPMLGELADAIAARIEEAQREGMKRAAEIARARTHKSITEIAPVGSDAYWQGSASSAECIRNAILSETGEEA